MPDEQPRPPQRSWKNATPSGGPAKSGPAWKGAADASPAAAAAAKQPWSRKSQLALAGLVFAVVIGAMTWIILWLRPVKPFRLVVLSAAYETNLAVPHNVPGKTTAARLADWARANDKLEVRQGDLTGDLAALKEGLKDCKEPTVVLYLAAHGAADEVGPYLLPQDADPRDPTRSRVRLPEILKQLGTLPAGTKKLLILDATQVAASWPLGVFHNDFAHKLQDLKPLIEEFPGLIVLSASAEDQRSWVSEEWRQSIFGHHVLEGLRGAADEGTRRVNALGLAEYVQKKVKLWARHNRSALQTPVLLGGDDRARGIELIGVEDRYRPPDAMLVGRFEAPLELEKAWAECAALGRATPPPFVYTPHLWRQYLETLLRCEQLVRADDRTTAERLLAEAAAPLAKKIAAARSRKLYSALGTLAMPTALGYGAPIADDSKRARELRELWGKGDQSEPVRDQVAKWVAEEKDPWQRQLLRVRLSGLLLRQAEAEAERDLKQVAALLAAREDVSAPRPAEAHYAVMLARDLIPQPPWATVKEFLRLRRTAEEAALGLNVDTEAVPAEPPYSEQLSPAILKLVDDADRARRPGEDLLFASAEGDWGKAAGHLKEAVGLYQKAQRAALALRKALRQRDEVLASLPYYSQWTAGQPFDPAQPNAFNDRVEGDLRLWQAAHELDRGLRQLDPETGPALVKLTEAVAKGFGERAQEFAAFCDPKKYAVLPENWHKIDGLLAVPFIPPDTRGKLLGKLREISWELHRHTEKEGGDQVMSAEQARRLARAQARAQGKLALAVLGEDAFTAEKGRAVYKVTDEAVEALRNTGWEQDMNQAGDEVSGRWNRLPALLDGKVAAARKEEPEKALALARAAAALARRLPGSAVPWLALDPLEEQRRLQLHDLLCRQARRTSLDFWAAESPRALPYYRAAGQVFVEDAGAVLAGGEAGAPKQPANRLGRVAGLQKELEDEKRVPVVAWSLDGRRFEIGKTSLWLTDEPELPLSYAVQAPALLEEPPPGHPILWAELTGDTAFLKPRADKGTVRHVQPRIWPDAKDNSPVSYSLVRQRRGQLPGKEPGRQVVHGLFRGHRPLAEAVVEDYALPDAAAALPDMPPGGKIAVQTPRNVYARYAEGTGAIAVVLDCSGSMNYPEGAAITRFVEAKRALDEVLAALPKGTQLTLWAFSHAVNLDTREDMRQWDPEKTIQVVYSTKKWDRAIDMAKLQARVQKLVAWNETPIVRSMVRAMEKLQEHLGLKNLVILTDGQDNRFEKNGLKWDKELNPGGKLTIPKYLEKTYKDTDVAIRVIGFQLPPGELDEVKRQFKVPLERLRTKGRFFDVSKTADLIEALRASLKQRLFFTLEEGSSGRLVKKYRQGVDISELGANSHWADLDPGYYWVNVERTQLRQKVKIDRGDRLRLDLYGKPSGLFVFQPDPVENAYPGARYLRKAAAAKDWLVTVLQNQGLQREDAVQMTVAIEKLSDREFDGTGTLSQVTPGLILFRVTPPAGTKALPTLRFHPLADYAAPTWNLQVRPWRQSAAPVLEAFWSIDEPKTAIVLRKNTHFDNTLKPLPAAADLEVSLGNKQGPARVQLLTLGVEDHEVDTYDGKRRQVKCFVVRLRYPPGKENEVLVQLPGYEGGQEHRFYSRAGKYTGIFWEYTEQQARQQIETLSVIGVEAFREAARRSGHHVRIDELGPPDDRPRPRPQ